MRSPRSHDERCEGCARLADEMVRLREATEKRARDDHDRCVALYAQMERLARINQSVLHDVAGSDDGGDCGDWSCCELATRRGKSTRATDQDERVERLQGIVMEQAKELETLRRRGSSYNRRSQAKVDTTTDCMSCLHLGDNQEDEREDAASGGRENVAPTRADRAPVSLLAQLDAKDRRIHALEVTLSKMEAQLHQVQTKKLEAARESQQQLGRLQQQTRKYEAYIRKQRREMQSLEKKQSETRQYVDVLERKLVTVSDKRAVRRDFNPLRS